MDLNTVLMRKQAGAWDYYSVVPVKQNNGWVYDSVTKSAIPSQYYFGNTGSYDDDHSVSLYDEDEFNQLASRYNGNDFDFQAYNSSGRDLGRYAANQMHAQRGANTQQQNINDYNRRAAEVDNYKNTQWKEYQAVMDRVRAQNAAQRPQAGAQMSNPYGDGSINTASYTPDRAVTKSITSSTAAPVQNNTTGFTASNSKPLTLGGSPDFSTGSDWMYDQNIPDFSAPHHTNPNTAAAPVVKKKKKKKRRVAGVGAAVGSAPADPGGHITRDQALMLLHKGYSPNSRGGFTQSYDNPLTRDHLTRMNDDPNYNPFGHYSKSQAENIISNSYKSERTLLPATGKYYELKDPLQARQYYADRAKHKASLDPNSAEYKRLYPSSRKYTPQQIKKQNDYAAKYGYIPGHLM